MKIKRYLNIIENIKVDYMSGLPLIEICKKYNISHSDIKEIRKQEKLAHRRKSNLILELNIQEDITKDYTDGNLTINEIADKYSIGSATVSRFIRKNKLFNRRNNDVGPKVSIGDIIDNLTIISDPFIINKTGTKNQYYIVCKCSCGKEKIMECYSSGLPRSRSCGCKINEYRKEIMKQMGTWDKWRETINVKHKLSYDSAYITFHRMKQRCYNPKNKDFAHYGGRKPNPVTICEEWLSDVTKFVKWARDNGYQEGLTINRIDEELGYFPENCEWITGPENSKWVTKGRDLKIKNLREEVISLKSQLQILTQENLSLKQSMGLIPILENELIDS